MNGTPGGHEKPSRFSKTDIVIIGLIVYCLSAGAAITGLAFGGKEIPSELSISLSTTVGAVCGVAAHSAKQH